jgi:protein-disulfide isomerase
MAENGLTNNEPFFELPTAKIPEETERRKKWYKKWWGILISVSGGLFLILILLFVSQVFYYYNELKSGRMSFPSKIKFQRASAANAGGQNFDPQKINPSGEPNSSPGAPITITGFFDFQCPFSQEASAIVGQMRNLYGGKVNFIFRNFPITEIHPDAMLAAQAGECAQNENLFWPMHDKIFAGQNLKDDTLKNEAQELGFDAEKFSLCLSGYDSRGKVLKDILDGQSLGVSGTPTWFIEGEKIEGVIQTEIFKKIIDFLLVQKESQKP